MAECEGSARDRHLHSHLLTPVRNKAFQKDVRNAIRSGETTSHPATFW